MLSYSFNKIAGYMYTLFFTGLALTLMLVLVYVNQTPLFVIIFFLFNTFWVLYLSVSYIS